MMKRLLAMTLMLLLLLPAFACAQEGIVINKIKDKTAEFAFPEDAKLLEVYFPQIYGCDAALVRYGDMTMLIDCAGTQWKQVDDLLKRLKVTELTYAVNSHPDADHIGGLNSIAKRYPIGTFILGFPEDYDAGDEVRFKVYEDLHALGVPFRRVQEGDTIDFGDVKITVHQRLDEHLPRVNNKSVTLMIEHGERRIYFTGDIQGPAQQLLGESGLDLKTDILKYPHHGYEPMHESFVAATSPELVIATSGQVNEKGIVFLREKGIPAQMTASFVVKLTTDGSVWVMERL